MVEMNQTREDEPLRQSSAPQPAKKLLLKNSISHEQEAGLRETGEDFRRGREEVLMPLERKQPGDHSDHCLVLGNAEPASSPFPKNGGIQKGVEVHP